MTTVIETCRIPPAPGCAAELTVPLSFFDLVWLHFGPTRRLIFYDHRCSEPEFLNTIVPKLKQSLSLSLKHYLPVAANLYYPLDTDRNHPLIRYVSGDTAPLTIAVSGEDFDELTGNHARESDQFYDFIPEMPPLRDEREYKLVSLLALQVTLFPGRGICIGLSNHHCLGHARSVAGFMWAWAEINKFDGDDEFLSRNGESLPHFDRSVLGDCGRVNDMYWDVMKKRPLKPSSFPLPMNRVRASFNLSQSDIKKLKNLVLSHNPAPLHVSSFVITAAYVWSCVVKSAGEEVGGDEAEIFRLPVDGRGRLNALIDPPVPLNYFGNCLGAEMVIIEHRKVAADDGFLVAAEAIADQIKNQINDKDNFMKDLDKKEWLSSMPKISKMSTFSVTGSPKFDLSNADFGWGKGRRVEVLLMDGEQYSMSLCNSSDCDGGLVVGLSLPTKRMEAFAVIFENGLNSCTTKMVKIADRFSRQTRAGRQIPTDHLSVKMPTKMPTNRLSAKCGNYFSIN